MRLTSAQPARLKLALLDPQVGRELGIVASDLLDEALRFLAADKRLDGLTEWEVGESDSSITAYTITARRMTGEPRVVEMACPDMARLPRVLGA